MQQLKLKIVSLQKSVLLMQRPRLLMRLQQQMQLMAQTQAVILDRLGMGTTESPSGPNNPEEASSTGAESPATV